jgi:hypothetical protein
MKIIAFDPGGTTGYAVGILEEKEGILYVKANQYAFTYLDLFDFLTAQEADRIICESFEYRNKARPGLNLISCEMIGIIKLCSDLLNFELKMQTAAVGKGHFTDKKIKDAGCWIPGKPHGMDALRHLLQWYTFGEGYQFNKKGFTHTS